MEYLNFDVEIAPGSGNLYPVAANSEAGEGHLGMRFPFDSAALSNALLHVQNALLRAAAPRRQVLSPEDQLVQAFGQQLFEALFAGEVLRLYEASGALAEKQRKGLRVRLRILAPDLATVPWEMLYDSTQDEYLCFLSNTLLVRYLEVPHLIQPLSVELPLQVLAMIVAPSDQGRLDVEHERLQLLEAMAPLEQRGLLQLRWVPGQTWHALQQMLWQQDWHIFHFIGHGGFDPQSQEGVLALANEQGRSHLLNATELGRLLAQRQALRLVVLNACQGAAGSQADLFSSTAATLARRGIPAVLAMQYEITDRAAIELTRGFYGALTAGLPVDEAVTQARTSISVGLTRTLEWVTPVLYLRAPDGVLFHLPPTTTMLPPMAPRPQLPPSPTNTSPGGAGWHLTTEAHPPFIATQEPVPAPPPQVNPRSPTPFQRSQATQEVITGEARGITQRTEQVPDERGVTVTVMAFRVERYDSTGNRLPPIPVEMRGRSLEGAINEGDWIEVPGIWHEGHTLRAKRVRNLTTGTVVKIGESAMSGPAKIMITLFLLIFAAVGPAFGLGTVLWAGEHMPFFMKIVFVLVGAAFMLVPLSIVVRIWQRREDAW